ncbi:MAG TPA: rhombosortase [Gammaproteobacteria bacterium]|nr:rhombosortase [Gammaproteobacteria bacterium]
MNPAFQSEGRHGGITLPWRSILLGAAAAAAYLVLGPAPEGWVFDRSAIARGEWWRLVTGHWVHSDPVHAGWDIAALLLLGILFEARLRWWLPGALLIGTFGVDIWLWWGDPALYFYCGLSGILNCLLITGLLQLWLDIRHPLVVLTGMGAAVKIIVEINSGQALLTRIAWPSVPTVHAAGFLCGLLLYVLRIRTVGDLPMPGSARKSRSSRLPVRVASRGERQ